MNISTEVNMLKRESVSMEPVAWAIFAANGNIRIWSPDQEPVRKVAEREGLPVVPLYSPQQPLVMRSAASAERVRK